MLVKHDTDLLRKEMAASRKSTQLFLSLSACPCKLYIHELLTALPSHTLEEIASEINRTEAELDVVTRRKSRLTSSTNLSLTRRERSFKFDSIVFRCTEHELGKIL